MKHLMGGGGRRGRPIGPGIKWPTFHGINTVILPVRSIPIREAPRELMDDMKWKKN